MTIKQLKSNLNSIKEIIGWKKFPADKDELLIQAFIRRSYSQEHPEWQHNQVLEFIGDSVLDNFFVRYMCRPAFNHYGSFTKNYQYSSKKNEGELTQIKNQYVNGDELAKHIDKLKLAQYLILGGADEKNNIRNKKAAKEDLFESIIGSVALACEFQNSVIDKVCKTMLELDSTKKETPKTNSKIKEMRKLVGEYDYDNAVQKLTILNQNKHIPIPVYNFKGGNDGGEPEWFCSCSVDGYGGRVNSSAQSKKKIARQIAAYGMLEVILGYKDNK